MQDASEYGTHYQELCQYLLPYLPKSGSICDAGCGLGYLAQALSEHCQEITAIDISPSAIEAFRSRVQSKHLHIRCENIFDIDTTFDALIFCYFGRTEEILRLSKKLCHGNVVVVKRDCSEHTFSLGEVKRKHHSIDDLTRTLTETEVPFVKKQLRLEMGQPFRTFDDAMRFFQLYNKSEQAVTEQLVKARLLATNDAKFPFFLPSVRKMELIVFSANDL